MKRTIIEIVAVLYIILFLYAGISKLLEYSVFVEQLSLSPILHFAAKPIAVLVPVVELLFALILTVPKLRLKALYMSIALLTLFTIYITALFFVDDKLPCSCGGIIGLLSWKQHIAFNFLFIGLAIWAILLLKKIRIGERQQWYKFTQDQWRVS